MTNLKMKVKKLHPLARLPVRANPAAAGLDVFAAMADSVMSIPAKTSAIVPLGISWELNDESYFVDIRPRSGLASKGISAHLGTIDFDYRKEVGVIIHNLSNETLSIKCGDKIAQLVIQKRIPVDIEWGEIEETERGGFGSTGS